LDTNILIGKDRICRKWKITGYPQKSLRGFFAQSVACPWIQLWWSDLLQGILGDWLLKGEFVYAKRI
jgi:hypothetical protein